MYRDTEQLVVQARMVPSMRRREIEQCDPDEGLSARMIVSCAAGCQRSKVDGICEPGESQMGPGHSFKCDVSALLL